MGNSVKKNIAYSFAYQILAFIIPLAVSPYIARTLGAEKIGIYSYTYSVAHYFMMIVMLGVLNYGTRSIAKVRDDNALLEKTFCGIYSIQLTMLIVSLSTYLLYCFVRKSDFFYVELCQSFFILSYGLDITWFFYGKESFKLIALRNGLVKILNASLIFMLVKEPEDIWVYTLVMSGCTLMGQLVQWPHLLRSINILHLRFYDTKRHLKGMIILFIPVLAISVFVYMDKIMIGLLSNMSEAGFYENSDRILSIPKAFIQAVGAVMLPHAANMLTNGNLNQILYSIKTTMFFVVGIACACFWGLAGVAPIFSVVFWGGDFSRCSDVVTIISFSLLFSCFGNVVRTQYLIPKEHDKEYTISLIIGAVVNLVINFILIGKYGAVGAAFGTVAAEIALCTYQTWSVRHELEIKFYMLRGIPFFIIGLIMFVLLRFLQIIIAYNVLNLLLLILGGMFFFTCLSMCYMRLSSNNTTRQMFDLIISFFKSHLYNKKRNE